MGKISGFLLIENYSLNCQKTTGNAGTNYSNVSSLPSQAAPSLSVGSLPLVVATLCPAASLLPLLLVFPSPT